MSPLINGVNYAWASITCVLFGVPLVAITKIDWKRAQEKTNNYGAGVEPVSRGYGNVEYTGSIEVYQDLWRQLILAAPDKDPLKWGPFEIAVVFGPTRIQSTTTILKMVEFTEDALTANQGDSKLTVNIPLIIGGIQHI